jgi:predicted MFS family arabinose efflux permease
MKQNRTTEDTLESAQEPTRSPVARSLVWILSIACAIGIANLYYIQPLLVTMSHTFGVTQKTMGFVATLAQLGFASGLLLIVPLGDVYNRRNLITLTLLAVTITLIAAAIAPNIIWLMIAFYLVGVTTVVPQIIVPFAAHLAHPQERGRVVGTVMSGLLIGILLARTVSGFVGQALGWRVMYWIAAALMLLLALLLRLLLPDEQPESTLSYRQLLSSLWELLRTEPVLREASIFGSLVSGTFSVFWVTLAFFLAGPPYHYGPQVAGLFGLVGVVGAFAASWVGKLADHVEARIVTGIMLVPALASFIIFWSLGYWIWGLIIGVILLDLGAQGTHISNQARIFALHPQARSRINTVYMVSYFIGGSLGSVLGSYGWSVGGWTGACAVGVVLLVTAHIVYVRGLWKLRVRQ